jgi:hypothetical protein
MGRAWPILLVAAALAAPAAAQGPPPRPCGAAPFPPRRPDAITGSEFARRTTGLSAADRQHLALEEVRRGNVPDFLRRLQPVWMRAAGADASTGDGVRICVAPDYLALGSDADFLRLPLAYPEATHIASEFGFVLPTRKMVDAIYEQSAYHLTPQPLPPGPQMRSVRYALWHQQEIEAQRALASPLGVLLSGHKKDLVLTNRLLAHRDRVAIYGWHRLDGRPIQPLSTVHGTRYADYSHGLRLVEDTAWLGGSDRSILALLEDPAVAPLLSYEGVLPARRLMAPGFPVDPRPARGAPGRPAL